MSNRQLPDPVLPDSLLEMHPQVDPTAFVAPGAVVISRVSLAKESSVWYNTVLRGDINKIEIGERSNIQDGSIIHLANDFPCIVGKEVSIGHHVNLHGCTVGDGVLVGIGAIVLTGAIIGDEAMIAAGCVVKENQVIESGFLYAGVPAKKIRALTDGEKQNNRLMAGKYVAQSRLYLSKGDAVPMYKPL